MFLFFCQELERFHNEGKEKLEDEEAAQQGGKSEEQKRETSERWQVPFSNLLELLN